ncbi:hypothetical protein BZG36_02184 [Bifiguratus adelaidae]|uniref:Uncharacterized protein n=1 Tax=Bifiguratus adelaidae TaxID=1938954 RepID=A0A261Y0Q9_9FUNG|nr:hypothetical protein BZG36_02184 [Bifiguratus adelaidae]
MASVERQVIELHRKSHHVTRTEARPSKRVKIVEERDDGTDGGYDENEEGQGNSPHATANGDAKPVDKTWQDLTNVNAELDNISILTAQFQVVHV